MKIYCIADNQETEMGFKLVGCDGITLNDNAQIVNKLEEIVNNKDYGVLIITSKIYSQSKEKIDSIRQNKKLPLIAII